MANQAHRILRNYRNAPPTKFHDINQRVCTKLADKTRFPDSLWIATPTLLDSYLSTSAKHDSIFHEAKLGSKLIISERDILQEQLVIFLDEIASVLELAAVRNPDILIASGFDLTKERRTHSRAKVAAATRNAAHDEQEGV